jgi:hypothetical protein
MRWRIQRRSVNGCAAQQLVARQAKEMNQNSEIGPGSSEKWQPGKK